MIFPSLSVQSCMVLVCTWRAIWGSVFCWRTLSHVDTRSLRSSFSCRQKTKILFLCNITWALIFSFFFLPVFSFPDTKQICFCRNRRGIAPAFLCWLAGKVQFWCSFWPNIAFLFKPAQATAHCRRREFISHFVLVKVRAHTHTYPKPQNTSIFC